MKYKIEIEFDSQLELSELDERYLQDSLMLQILEPADYDGEDREWFGKDLSVRIQRA